MFSSKNPILCQEGLRETITIVHFLLAHPFLCVTLCIFNGEVLKHVLHWRCVIFCVIAHRLARLLCLIDRNAVELLELMFGDCIENLKRPMSSDVN